MATSFPMEFTLENGTHVAVTKGNTGSYQFQLTPTNGPGSHFVYTKNNRTKAEIESTLDFDQLNALRRFWLENEDVV